MPQPFHKFDIQYFKDLRRAEQWEVIDATAQKLMRNSTLPIPIAAEWAFALAKLNKSAEAEQIATQVLHAAPACLLAMRARIVALLQTKQLPEALRLAQSLFKPPFVLDDAEETASCILLLAIIHNGLGEREKAFALGTEAQQIHPTAKASGFLGLLSFQQGNLDQAIQFFTESLSVKTDPQVWKLLAEAYHHQNRIDDMVQTYEAAIHAHPDHEPFLINLGELYYLLNRYEEAEKYLRLAVKNNPESSAGWVNLSKLYYKQEQTDKYIDTLHTAVKLYPESPELLNNLAYIRTIQGKDDEALILLQQAYALAPLKDPIALALAQAYEKDNKPDMADSIVEQVFARNPHSSPVLRCRANISLMRKQPDEALSFLRQALANELWFLKQQSQLSLFGDGAHAPMDVYDASETLIAVCRFLERLEVPYFLIGGTLLGIVRDGELLPHDKDADLGIAWDVDRNWLMDQFEKSEEFSINGLRPEPEVAEWNFSVFRIGTPIGVDLFFQKTSGDNWLTGFHAKPSPWLQRFKQRKLTTIEYKGHLLPIPENPEGYLEEVYGPEWRIPMTSYDTIVAAENLCSEAFISAKIIGYDRLLEALQNRSWKKVLWYCEALKRFDNPPILDELAGWLRGALASTPSENDSKK